MISYPVRIADPHVRDKLKEIIDALNSSELELQANAAALSGLEPPLTLAEIQRELQVNGTNPINVTGLLGFLQNAQVAVQTGTHAQRLTTVPSAGQMWWETDRTSLYVCVTGGTWTYLGGLYATTFANTPADLGANDLGFQLWITVQNHKFRWSGSSWAMMDTEGGYIADRVAAPTTTGWQLCDGTATDYLQVIAGVITVTAFTTPDEDTAPAGVVHASIAAYTGVINPATAPTISGSTAAETATNQAAPTGITIVDHPSHTHDDASSLGAPDLFAPDATATGVAGQTGGPSATLVHPVTDPTHNHTQNSHTHGTGTLVVSATAMPLNLGVLRFFRR